MWNQVHPFLQLPKHIPKQRIWSEAKVAVCHAMYWCWLQRDGDVLWIDGSTYLLQFPGDNMIKLSTEIPAKMLLCVLWNLSVVFEWVTFGEVWINLMNWDHLTSANLPLEIFFVYDVGNFRVYISSKICLHGVETISSSINPTITLPHHHWLYDPPVGSLSPPGFAYHLSGSIIIVFASHHDYDV